MRQMNRRQALTALGGAVGAAVLGAACARDGSGSTAPDAGSGGTGTTATGASAGAVTADAFAAAASCTLTPEQTGGPYYLDIDQIRGDVREDREGTPLVVAARVMDVDGCTPVKDAVFEIWHCDATGLYSGFESASRAAGGGGPGGASAGGPDRTRYLRGAQVTDGDGIARITTIYPGWYQGRTVHIHAKVHLSNTEALTTQLYFDDEVSDRVFAAPPYAARTGRRTTNEADGIYRRETTLTVTEDGDGYLGLITIGIRA